MTRADGSSNGIELQPLRQMSGASGFCQEFIEGARAPLFNVIGGLNNGWRVAMTTLGNERGGRATTMHLRYEREFWDLVDDGAQAVQPIPTRWSGRTWRGPTPRSRSCGIRGSASSPPWRPRREPGPEASINKLFWSEYHKRFGNIAINLVGAQGMIRPEGPGYRTDRWQQAFLGQPCRDDLLGDERDPAQHHRRTGPRTPKGAGGRLIPAPRTHPSHDERTRSTKCRNKKP